MVNFWGLGPWGKSKKKDQEIKGKPRFAGYVLLDQLGQGGFGEVFLAIKYEEYEAGQYVALKKLQESQDPEEIKRFEREISILFDLKHPNVVEVLEYGEVENVCFYTMEILKGETLEARIETGPLDLERTVALVNQVGAGLYATHQKGIVHRDIKPNNIFLCEDSSAKIIDFGLAKDPKAAVKITLAGAAGSPFYMPPEVEPALHGPPDFNLTPAYDQFALAAVAFEALTAERPFIAKNVMPVLSSIFYSELKSLADFGVSKASELDPVMKKALHTKPEERYPTIKEFAEAFEAAAS